MKLYKATYNIKWDPVGPAEVYILAPDFQTAGKLAETGGSGNPIVGNVGGALLKVEQIADDVCDIQNTAKLAEIGSHTFSIVNKRLLKVELLAIDVIQE
jgi:hypothetical protein